MPFIFTKPNLSFRGPFTGTEAIAPGETKVILTSPQYADWNALDRTASAQRPVLFSVSNSPTFFYGTLDQSSLASSNLRWGLIFLFRKVSNNVDRVKLYPLYITLSGMFDMAGSDNGGAIKADIRTMIQDALSDESSQELINIQTSMLALPQWDY